MASETRFSAASVCGVNITTLLGPSPRTRFSSSKSSDAEVQAILCTRSSRIEASRFSPSLPNRVMRSPAKG